MDKPSKEESDGGPNKTPDDITHGKQSQIEELDDELEELLDDSLADFSTYTAPKTEPKKDATNSKQASDISQGAAAAPTTASKPTPAPDPEDDLMKALFSGGPGAGAGDFEQHLKSLLQDDPQAMAEFEKLTKEGPGGEQNASGQNDFASTLAETLSSLSANAESLKTEMTEEEMMKTFQQSLNLGAEGGGESEANFIPMMQNMMSNLLSKEILYPSLKDLADKYPDWLSTNNGKVPKAQFDLYVNQFDVVSKLCELYDEEKESDSQEVKDRRFEKILDLMTQMQDCGPPPKDIVGELAPGLNFDADGNPQLPGMEQCSIM